VWSKANNIKTGFHQDIVHEVAILMNINNRMAVIVRYSPLDKCIHVHVTRKARVSQTRCALTAF